MSDTKMFYVWLVASKDEFAEMLVAKLVRRGYTVGPLGRQLITKVDDNPSVMIGISLKREPKNDAETTEYVPAGIYREVADVMKQNKAKFWGIVVTESAWSTWALGNISNAAEEKEREEALAAKLKGMN